MSSHSRGTVAAICVFSAWLGLCHVSGPSCQAQQQSLDNNIEEPFARGGDPPPPGAVVHVQESDFWHPAKVRWAAFSPDSQTLLSFTDETLFQWEVPTGKLLAKTTFNGTQRSVPAHISPDGQVLATVDRDKPQFQLWSVQTEELLHTRGLDDRPHLLGFSPDSKQLLLQQQGSPEIQVWDVETGEKVREWNPEQREREEIRETTVATRDGHRGAAVSPNGKLRAVATPGEASRVHDVQTGEVISELRDQHGTYSARFIAGFLPDNQTLITVGTHGRITLWDAPSGEPKMTFRAEAFDAFLSYDGRWLAIQPEPYDWDREIQLWDPRTGQQLSTPRMRTYLRPVVFRLAAEDPMRIAIHWAGGWGGIPAAGRYLGEYSQAATLETMELHVITPSGEEYRLHPKVDQPNTEFSDYRLPRMQREFYELPSVFFELQEDGFKTLVLGHSGSWAETNGPSFDELGEYRISITGSIIIDGQDPIPFETAEATIERVAEGVLPLEEIHDQAIAKLQEALPGEEDAKIRPDKGGYGEYAPLHVIGLPTHERVVLLAVEHPSSTAGGRLLDQYPVVVEPDGTVTSVTHAREQTCLAVGTPVETEYGPRPIEQLQPGDRVWSFDLQAKRPLLTTVRATYRGETSEVIEINSTLAATAEHPIYANGKWVPAERLGKGDLVIGRTGSYALATAPQLLHRNTPAVDLTVDEPHNFFAGGLLVHNKSVWFNHGYFDRWRIFHIANSPYANQVASRVYWPWVVGIAFALMAVGVCIYALRRRRVIAPPPSRIPAGVLR